jgi:ABC-type uncharacterized transport system permease subunit
VLLAAAAAGAALMLIPTLLKCGSASTGRNDALLNFVVMHFVQMMLECP